MANVARRVEWVGEPITNINSNCLKQSRYLIGYLKTGYNYIKPHAVPSVVISQLQMVVGSLLLQSKIERGWVAKKESRVYLVRTTKFAFPF